MDDFDLIDSKEFGHVLPHGKGILGQLTIWERRTDGSRLGIVTFVIAAGQNSPIRGTTLFNEMMDFFGEDADMIHGVWRKPPSGDESTNIDKVNELTGQGMDLDEAIQHAWTATRARKRGFGRATLLGTPIGNAGSYVKIDVEIRKSP